MTAPVSARITHRRLYGLRKLSLSGNDDVAFVSFSCWNIGVSRNFSRMYRAMATRMSESQNGIRHPQALNSSTPMVCRVTRITNSDTNNPTVAVVWIQLE